MKSNLITFSILIMLLWSCREKKLDQSKKTDYRAELELTNNVIGRAIQNKNVDSIINLYNEEFTFMPEYKTAIFSKANLEQFYEKWLNSTDITIYKKNIYEVKIINGHVLEIGTFQMSFEQTMGSIKDYNGKYMIVWEKTNRGKLKIISEIFGSDIFVSPENVPYATVEVKDSTDKKPDHVDKKLKDEILKINQRVIKAVVEGNGIERTNGFTSDGIYMPHFGKMLVGKDSIKPYMLRTYEPEASLYVAHNYFDIYDFNDYVLVNAHFKGGWGDSTNGGTFEGNMSNLRKRTEDGELLMFRQLANNDR